MKSIQLEPSRYEIRFRVLSHTGKILFSSMDYSSAEEFIWRGYTGPSIELSISKVWVEKSSATRLEQEEK